MLALRARYPSTEQKSPVASVERKNLSCGSIGGAFLCDALTIVVFWKEHCLAVRQFNWVACIASPEAHRQMLGDWLKRQSVFESVAGKQQPPSFHEFVDEVTGEAWIRSQKNPTDWLLLPVISL